MAASRMTILHDWVDESTPATSAKARPFLSVVQVEVVQVRENPCAESSNPAQGWLQQLVGFSRSA
ncbi:hypothetical protein GCM10009717_30220 [Agromyces allii]|uniref:Uncharacterized protein n=1 Tax=Agromyces allii TaxID=393607 RepID=A0ABN2R0E9_9MICO